MSIMPSTAFMGVRTSWLMAARKALLARLAASAWMRARTSSPSMRLRSVTSRTTAATRSASCSCRAPKVISTGNSEPSLRRCTVSMTPEPRARMRSKASRRACVFIRGLMSAGPMNKSSSRL